ncbi:MAG TPA: hypothetical protein VNA67_09190 [Pseudonocardiaceae bacterium]|nr:hypothetical protein [Pseudonocardiaceae bacterium]
MSTAGGALGREGLMLANVDPCKINYAFASVAIQSIRALDIGSVVVNVNCYASAMGDRQHPAPVRTNQRSLGNMCLLCEHHHVIVHRQGWHIQLDARGHPESTPPKTVDPERRPLRNPFRR